MSLSAKSWWKIWTNIRQIHLHAYTYLLVSIKYLSTYSLCKYVRIKTCEKVLAPNRAESKLSLIHTHTHTPINAYKILLTSSQHQAGLSVELNNKASSFVARTYYEKSGDKAENDIMRIKCVILHNNKQKHTSQAYIWMCSTYNFVSLHCSTLNLKTKRTLQSDLTDQINKHSVPDFDIPATNLAKFYV